MHMTVGFRVTDQHDRVVAYPRVRAALRALRKAAGLTQEATAHAFGLTFAGYRPYERGERDLTLSQVETFAAIFGVPVSEMVRRIWPEESAISEARYSAEMAEIERQTADLSPEVRERVMRGYRQSLEIAQAVDPLARRN